MFSYTEQLNRRTTYLAAYKLERDRLKAMSDVPFDNLSIEQREQIYEKASLFATKAVNTSQGEYAMYNRSEIARGPVLGLVMMYKQFVIISVQLMKGMDYKGRLMMLSMLLFFSGLKGVPFADDLMDLIDTLLQKFNIRMSAVEQQLAELSDALIPGSSPYVMRVVLDAFTGATISTRLGFGDLVPLTGAFKAKQTGADHWREATNFFGPIWSSSAGMVGTASQLVRYGAEKVGFLDDTTRLSTILRETPVSALRGLVDGMTYLHDGKITRSDGTVIDNDAGIRTSIFRMLGFYPASATQQNDLIRLAKQSQAYVQDLKSHYKQAWVKAKLDGDRGEMSRIQRLVREWNKDMKGTEFFFKDFYGSANRSYKAAKLNSIDRYRKFAPKTMRGEIDRLMEIYGIETP